MTTWYHLSPRKNLRILRAPFYVAPSIEQCLFALPQRRYTNVFVYVVNNGFVQPTPGTEFDKHVTKEHIFNNDLPCTLEKVLDLSDGVVTRFLYADNSGLETNCGNTRIQRQYLSARFRILRAYLTENGII